MRKLLYITYIAISVLLASCNEAYNEKNFPDYTNASKPTNVVSYTYTLTDADYATIETNVKKPVNDSITLLKTKLKTASKADSVTINASITRLNAKFTTDSLYIKATYIKNNKMFNAKNKAAVYLPYLLNSLYKYTDRNSACKVIYNDVDNGDTTAITAINKSVLTDADYISMGMAANQPGQYKNFSTVMSVMTYLNQFLKIKYPYAQTGESRMVTYLYYDSNKTTKKQYRVLTFDGQNWINASAQYVHNGTAWVFDPTLYITMKKGLNATDDYMLVINYIKDHQAVTTPSLLGYYSTTLEYEYYYGFDAYHGNISWSNTDRMKDPTYAALKTTAEKDDYKSKRTEEGLAVYLGLKYPDAQPQVSGVDVYCYVTTGIYDGAATTNYRYKYQRIDNNDLKWKYINKEKL